MLFRSNLPVIGSLNRANNSFIEGDYLWCGLNFGCAVLEVSTLGIGGKVAGNLSSKVERGIASFINKTLEKGNFCFVAGTMILTTKDCIPIENIIVGDSVWTFNIGKGKIELTEVSNIFRRNSNEFIKLYFANDSIICTPEHPLFVNSSWIQAKELEKGSNLFSYTGEKIVVDSVFFFRTDAAKSVYNIEVKGNHNYYVSVSKVLVHNKPMQIGRIKTVLKSNSPIWKSLKKFKGNIKTTGSGKGKQYYQWDNTHGDIEVYNHNFQHQGSMNPITGEMYKPAIRGRELKR